MIRNIIYKKKILAKIIKSSYLKKKGINFFTSNKLSQQVAFMNHPTSHKIQPHLHKKRLKKVNDTVEVLIILDGVLRVDFYTEKKIFIFSKIAKKNDIVILLTGGHGFKILKNCKMIEVKQGPYDKKKDKFKF
tara:strand:+ start:1373 stop:1771 length:399 start_codon:yes stop_codon:yes gene_type:complete